MIIDIKKLDLPKPLTASEWSKNKGIIAKAAGETGVGAALDALAAAREKVVEKLKIPNFPADEQVSLGVTFDKWTHNASEKARDFMARVKLLSDATAKVETVATKAAAKFQQSKTIPKSSTEYAKSVIDAAKAYKKVVDGIPPNAATKIAADEGPRIKKEIAEMAKLIYKGQWAAMESGVAKMEKAKIGSFAGASVSANADKEWTAQIFQPTRGSLAALSKLVDVNPEIKAVFDRYNKLLHGGGDEMSWTSIAGRQDVIPKVFDTVQKMAADCRKLIKTYG